jgi:ABC-type multidrug transport system ATPase subunit
VDQIDQHHEYLKVGETLDYAFNCRRGTHAAPYFPKNSRNNAIIAEMDKNHFAVNLCLEAVGLARVKDTFVGNDVSVRGVSGGERRRVTLAELLCIGSPVFCFDEISTGLDGTFVLLLLTHDLFAEATLSKYCVYLSISLMQLPLHLKYAEACILQMRYKNK